MGQYEEKQLSKVIKKIDLKPLKKVHKHFRTCKRCLENFVTLGRYTKICDKCQLPRGFVDKCGNRRVILRNRKV
jgi:hypothetical protein